MAYVTGRSFNRQMLEDVVPIGAGLGFELSSASEANITVIALYNPFRGLFSICKVEREGFEVEIKS